MTQWSKNAERNKRIAEMLLSGESISNTAKTLHCGKATVSYWADKLNTRQLPRSEAVKERIRIRKLLGPAQATASNAAHWTKLRAVVIKEAIREWPRLSKDPESMACLGLYWGEGYKRSHHIGFVNCDPVAVKLIGEWLRQHTESPLQLVIRCYPDQDWSACGRFWEDLLGVPPKLIPKVGAKKKPRLAKHGICTLLVADWRLRLKIMVWFDLWRSMLTGTEPTADPAIPKQTMCSF